MFEIMWLRAQTKYATFFFFGFVIAVSNHKDLTNIRYQNLTALFAAHILWGVRILTSRYS